MQDTFVVPSLPAASNEAKLSVPTIRLILSDKKDENVLHLGCLATGQGSNTLVFENIPAQHSANELESAVTHLSGFSDCKICPIDDKVDLVVNFITTEDATMALATRPTIDLGNGVQSTARFADLEDDALEPARKKIKFESSDPPLPTCSICSCEIDGNIAKPCFFCKKEWCDECLAKQFSVALSDPERFPAMCCGKVLHFDVARGVLPLTDYTKYKERFEQHNTTKPVYCAKLSCSTFLPPRLTKPNAQGQVNCTECQNTTCVSCRVLVDPQVKHQCVLADEATAMLVKFGYKSCPRCGSGIAKMYGCSHVRCHCGSHWCWECQRPIQICWQRPCEANMEDGDYYSENESQIEDEDEDDSVTTVSMIPQPENVTTQPQPTPDAPETDSTQAAGPNLEVPDGSIDATTTVVPGEPVTTQPTVPIIADSLENLDDEGADEWEGGDWDFGYEPVDESWDTWGCMHRLAPVINQNVWGAHRNWTPSTEQSGRLTKRVDCQRCYRTVIMVDPTAEAVTQEVRRKDSGCDVSEAVDAAEISSATIKKEEKKKRKGKKKNERPELYNCTKCGMFYCLACKKATIRDIHNLKHQVARV